MDLSVFEQDETCKVTIIDPTTGKDTDIEIEVYSLDSKQYRKVTTAIAKSEEEKTGEFLLASLTKSWTNVQFKKKDVELTIENATELYGKVPVIYAQLEKVIYNRVKFMKALPKS